MSALVATRCCCWRQDTQHTFHLYISTKWCYTTSKHQRPVTATNHQQLPPVVPVHQHTGTVTPHQTPTTTRPDNAAAVLTKSMLQQPPQQQYSRCSSNRREARLKHANTTRHIIYQTPLVSTFEHCVQFKAVPKAWQDTCHDDMHVLPCVHACAHDRQIRCKAT